MLFLQPQTCVSANIGSGIHMRFFFIVYDAQRRFNISVAGKKLNVNVMLACGQAVKLVNFYDCGGGAFPNIRCTYP